MDEVALPEADLDVFAADGVLLEVRVAEHLKTRIGHGIGLQAPVSHSTVTWGVSRMVWGLREKLRNVREGGRARGRGTGHGLA